MEECPDIDCKNILTYKCMSFEEIAIYSVFWCAKCKTNFYYTLLDLQKITG